MTASTISSTDCVELFQRYVIPNYQRHPINLVRGKGSRVWDSEGHEYLDLFPGWGCNLLGHCPPAVVKAVQEQVETLIHVPNSWHIEQQGRWAQLLSRHSFDGQAFFCNSGAEANEAAIKLARLHCGPERFKIITFQNGFHGRTMAATTATAQPKYHEGLGPLMAGFQYARFGDLDSVQQLIDDQTCAIMIEPIQGEGGVNIPPVEFLIGLRELANQHELLLIFDEVQTGCGRTGEWFGYQHFDVTPDVMTLAKAICSGIAGGAMMTTTEIAPSLRPGMHASTFGGNPIAAAAGIATLETIENEGLLQHAKQLGELFEAQLNSLKESIEIIADVRVVGVMIGIELTIDGGPLVGECMERGLLINCTHDNVLRMLPAMNLTVAEAEKGLEILTEVLLACTTNSLGA